MSEFGELRAQHALVGLGSAALAAAERPEFSQRIKKVYKKRTNKQTTMYSALVHYSIHHRNYTVFSFGRL